jgi:hypothetical protein
LPLPPFFSGPAVPAILALADGTIFKGFSIGAAGHTTGEVVFNTAMTGYQEILTDPSYSRQLVTLTYPHIGNTGVNPEDVESDRVYAAGLSGFLAAASAAAKAFDAERPVTTQITPSTSQNLRLPMYFPPRLERSPIESVRPVSRSWTCVLHDC